MCFNQGFSISKLILLFFGIILYILSPIKVMHKIFKFIMFVNWLIDFNTIIYFRLLHVLNIVNHAHSYSFMQLLLNTCFSYIRGGYELPSKSSPSYENFKRLKVHVHWKWIFHEITFLSQNDWIPLFSNLGDFNCIFPKNNLLWCVIFTLLWWGIWHNTGRYS